EVGGEHASAAVHVVEEVGLRADRLGDLGSLAEEEDLVVAAPVAAADRGALERALARRGGVDLLAVRAVDAHAAVAARVRELAVGDADLADEALERVDVARRDGGERD